MNSSLPQIIELISRYKQHVRETRLEDELYKWQLIENFKGRPDVDAPDFRAELLGLNYGNLIFHRSQAVIQFIADLRPEEYRRAFSNLFAEHVDLSQRISEFQLSSLQIFDEIKKDESHTPFHDERAISTILAVKFPERYSFYKDSFYGKLCNLIGIPKAKAGEKLVHYLELIHQFASKYLANDAELLELVDGCLTSDCYEDPNRLLLAQDILYQMLDKEPVNKAADQSESIDDPVNYWVFQGNPDRYNLVADLQNGVDVNEWSVAAHKEKIKPGDLVILWTTGNEAGCYAVARVTSDVFERNDPVFGKHAVKIEVINYNLEKPVTAAIVRATPSLNGLKVGTQGTNFVATQLQFETIRNLLTGNRTSLKAKMLSNNIILYGPPGTGKTYNSIEHAVRIVDGIELPDHGSYKDRFDELRREGQIEFVTFHQNYSYEDFMVGIRPDVENESLRFQSQRGIFYQIVRKARENYENSQLNAGRLRPFDEVFSEIIQPIEEGDEVPIKMASGIEFRITEVSDKSISFTKKSGGRDHTLSITTLRDVVDGVRDVPGGLGSYYTPLVNLIIAKRATAEPAESEKRFVIIIDEINRANISRVFGELITLLEEDKRLGADNELRVTLPNGEKDFGIPPNLYIVGTMNTADKSIALVDIALRRRFEFVGFQPRPNLLTDETASQLLTHINKRIFEKKKSPDFLIGHAYFMTGMTIEDVLRKKVVPLLNEYFSGKPEIIKDIFDGSGWSAMFNIETFEWDIEEE